MECEEIRVDMRVLDEAGRSEAIRTEPLLYKLNTMMRFDPEYPTVLKEIFRENIGENRFIAAPLRGACISTVKIGKGVFINSNCLMMGRGGITIEDDVQIAANVQLISNNHDPYDLSVLLCRPVLIQEGAWIGAGATILPGVRVGRHAVVGAASVVTKDVPDYAVVVGNPAKIVKMLDESKFNGNERSTSLFYSEGASKNA